MRNIHQNQSVDETSTSIPPSTLTSTSLTSASYTVLSLTSQRRTTFSEQFKKEWLPGHRMPSSIPSDTGRILFFFILVTTIVPLGPTSSSDHMISYCRVLGLLSSQLSWYFVLPNIKITSNMLAYPYPNTVIPYSSDLAPTIISTLTKGTII